MEEYERLTTLPLDRPCARIPVGDMRRQFMTLTGLRHRVVEDEITSDHVLPQRFLIDRFRSVDSYARHSGDFTSPEDQWHLARVDVLVLCVMAYVYMPRYMDEMDIDVIMTVRALREGHTIIPMIVAEMLSSSTFCSPYPAEVFTGSSTMLYVWFMSHLRPIGTFRQHGYCFTHDIAMSYSFQPSECTDAMSWSVFLAGIRDPFGILPCSGLSSPNSFITHALGMDYLPLTGLRGMTTYHPLVVMSQFDQFQDFHPFDGALG